MYLGLQNYLWGAMLGVPYSESSMNKLAVTNGKGNIPLRYIKKDDRIWWSGLVVSSSKRLFRRFRASIIGTSVKNKRIRKLMKISLKQTRRVLNALVDENFQVSTRYAWFPGEIAAGFTGVSRTRSCANNSPKTCNRHENLPWKFPTLLGLLAFPLPLAIIRTNEKSICRMAHFHPEAESSRFFLDVVNSH
jgi:hypothetical protein